MRIVSLLPSATEILCELGLRDQLVGVSHECDFPESVLALPKVTRTLLPADASSREIDTLVREQMRSRGSLYALDLATLEALQPDVIVTQALCDVCAVAEAEVQEAACWLPGRPKVINLEPETLAQVFEAMRKVARAVGAERAAEAAIARLEARVEAVKSRAAQLKRHPRVALLEWLDPPFACGHWNPELVRLAGGIEGLGREGERSRTVTWEEVIAWQPEVVLIACCGFSVERTLQDVPLLAGVPGWDELPAVRSGRVYVTDGAAYFSRPGPRLVDSLEILAHVIAPEAHPLPARLPRPVPVAVPCPPGS
jgi:iron complex transport system substrate-binding protein